MLRRCLATSRRSAYRGHLPTSPLQKVVAAGVSSVLSLRDPARADMVGLLGEATGRVALERLRRTMRESDEGREVLERRPVVSSEAADAETLLADCAEPRPRRASRGGVPSRRRDVSFVEPLPRPQAPRAPSAPRTASSCGSTASTRTTGRP